MPLKQRFIWVLIEEGTFILKILSYNEVGVPPQKKYMNVLFPGTWIFYLICKKGL